MCAPRWHGTHRYDIQVFATRASTWVHRYSSLLQLSVPLGQRGHEAMVLCTKCTLHSNHRLAHVIFQHTKRLLHRSGHFITTLASPSGRNLNYDEKQLTGGGGGDFFFSYSFYLYRSRKCVSYGFPTTHFCNHRIHYETSCIMNLTFGRASNLYLCLYNQLFALFHYVLNFLTP